ncbi:hypothetical protein CCACVL1_03412 [Corchorus capsularis]|uniref:BED-type domain-containing protein n=1 Tax=Corchorus capsularis TaxID=210143 RepID=A0A1R3JZK4_COCAP|nr:hypothetical protein CCACVL1_03412 [Corchorus capsularis]
MGGDMVLITFESKEEMLLALDLDHEWLLNGFVNVSPWKASGVCQSKLFRLNLSDISLHAWPNNFFFSVGGLWGEVVTLDEITTKKKIGFASCGPSGDFPSQVANSNSNNEFSASVRQNLENDSPDQIPVLNSNTKFSDDDLQHLEADSLFQVFIRIEFLSIIMMIGNILKLIHFFSSNNEATSNTQCDGNLKEHEDVDGLVGFDGDKDESNDGNSFNDKQSHSQRMKGSGRKSRDLEDIEEDIEEDWSFGFGLYGSRVIQVTGHLGYESLGFGSSGLHRNLPVRGKVTSPLSGSLRKLFASRSLTELDADLDEGELRDLGLAGGSDQGLSGCTTQSGKPPLDPSSRKKARTTASTPSSSSRKTSIVWEHVTTFEGVGGSFMAKCNYCPKTFKAHTKRNGTSSMKSHLENSCPKSPLRAVATGIEQDSSQTELTFNVEEGGNGSGSVGTWKFSQEATRKVVATMIIIDELPFRFVEAKGFRHAMKTTQPKFVMPSRKTIAKDCFQLYCDAKKQVKKQMNSNRFRVSLTTDTWTSIQKSSHMCGLDTVFCVTVDNATNNDVAVGYLKKKFLKEKTCLGGGKFLHMRCVAHILNLIVGDGLKEKEFDSSVGKIREAVKFVRASNGRLEKFMACAKKEKVKCDKGLCLDVCTRWNSTYLMLDVAERYEKAFEAFEYVDPIYREHLRASGGLPTSSDFEVARCLCIFLKKFYTLTVKVSDTSYVTSSSLLDEVFKIDKMNMIIYVASILDPRKKLGFVDFCIQRMYNEGEYSDLMKTMQEATKELFEGYKTLLSPEKGSGSGGNDATMEEAVTSVDPLGEGNEESAMDMFWKHEMESGKEENRSELDVYLKEDLEKKAGDFDVLGWWKMNSPRFPILSCMVRDVLVVPVSTVASESAFSTGGRVLDVYRSRLNSKFVQALVCGQDWLRGTFDINLNADMKEQSEFDQLAQSYSKQFNLCIFAKQFDNFKFDIQLELKKPSGDENRPPDRNRLRSVDCGFHHLPIAHSVDRLGIWHRLPVFLGVIYLAIRRYLHQEYNLLNVGNSPSGVRVNPGDNYHYRTAKGRCNEPLNEGAGSQESFFGRNILPVPQDDKLMKPDPMVVATKLLARRNYKDTGKQLNIISASWIQFMIHDWVDHMEEYTKQVELTAPKEVANKCPLTRFRFYKTKEFQTGFNEIKTVTKNIRTPWWDGSVIYGSDVTSLEKVRTFIDGKLKIAEDGLLQHDKDGIPIVGDVRNSWAGVSTLQALFIKGHNAICNALKEEYPELNDEELYRHGKLVTSAVIAKIHTIDWTVELLKTDTLLAGMRVHWNTNVAPGANKSPPLLHK